MLVFLGLCSATVGGCILDGLERGAQLLFELGSMSSVNGVLLFGENGPLRRCELVVRKISRTD